MSEVLARVLGEPVRVTPGGRTDSGVHALGQVVSMQTASSMAVQDLKRALNALVGEDLVISDVVEAEPGFDARKDARSREYEYAVWNGPDRSVVHRRWTAHVSDPLDVEAMDLACQVLVGKHDFAAFRTHRSQDDPLASTVRGVTSIRWRRDETEPRLVKLRIEADGFLRHMVRSIVGSAIRVGVGKAPVGWIGEALAQKERAAAGPTAAAAGLTLLEITY